jgi:hypothetical protein
MKNTTYFIGGVIIGALAVRYMSRNKFSSETSTESDNGDMSEAIGRNPKKGRRVLCGAGVSEENCRSTCRQAGATYGSYWGSQGLVQWCEYL